MATNGIAGKGPQSDLTHCSSLWILQAMALSHSTSVCMYIVLNHFNRIHDLKLIASKHTPPLTGQQGEASPAPLTLPDPTTE